jgi:hydrogenase maturation protease
MPVLPGEPEILVIGVGNAYRRDDAVGLLVAQRLRLQSSDRVNILEESGEGAALMEAWKGAEAVILVDAVQSGAKPGTIHRLDAHAEALPARFFHYSSHAFSVAEAVELARTLGQLPPRFIVYGVEGKSFTAGVGLTSEVKRAAQQVVTRVRRDLRENLPAIDSGG